MVKFCIGIDFSKKTFDATVIPCDDLESRGIHREFRNTLDGMGRMLRWVLESTGSSDYGDMLFCGEDTGLYSKTVSDGLAAKGCFMWLESALRIKRSLGISRGKDDRKDSREIALYAARFRDKARRHVLPDKHVDALKMLFMRRRFLVGQLKALRQRSKEAVAVLGDCKELESSFLSDGRLINAFLREIARVEKKIRELVDASRQVSRSYRILTSMKGIGMVNAVALIVYTGNFSKFDYDARRIASFWGVAPFGRQSGTSLNTTPHVSHYADKYLKSLLSEAALCAMRFCPVIKEYAGRLLARGKHPSVVKNNVKNKMLHILVAMVRDGRMFQENISKAEEAA